jgi:UDP-perosamine 4-acetyltransferase
MMPPHPPAPRLLIWGGGGHGKVVADLVRAVGGIVIGFVDAAPEKLGQPVEPGGGYVVLAQDDLIARVKGGALPDGVDAVALAVGHNATRLACLGVLNGFATSALVHPSAVVSPSAQLGRGTVVFPAAVVNAAARIGDAAIINSGAIVEHDCVVGDGAHVSPGAVLTGGVSVGARSWIGAGATVVPGVRIGADVVVGAGAVVLRDVPDGATVAGVPARPLAR